MSREASFPAMGVDVAVGGANDAEVGAVKALFADWEQVFSRFRADSELTRVNRAGHVAELSPLFADVPRARACRRGSDPRSRRPHARDGARVGGLRPRLRTAR
jgi:thiamine biosynthesis lipoprotein ApbE